MAEGPEKEDPRQKEQEREERDRRKGLGTQREGTGRGRVERGEEKESRGGGRRRREMRDRVGRRVRWDIQREGEKERCFSSKGDFLRWLCTLVSPRRSGTDATRRTAPRTAAHRTVVEIVPVYPPGSLVGANELSGIPRESRHGRRWWGNAGRGRDRDGEEWWTRVWDARKDGGGGGGWWGNFPRRGRGRASAA